MLVDNEPGVLSRVAGLFSGRGFNIESLCVAPTIDAPVPHHPHVTKANPPLVEQIEKQLNKLINIIKVRDLTIEESVQREMALSRVKASPNPG
jgi:acetolactate synthase-1/3 small subunit